MTAGRRWGRVVLISAGTVGVLAAAGWFAGPSLLQGFVENRLRAELASRGDVLTFQSLQLTATTLTLGRLCLQDGDLELGCVDEVGVGFRRDGWFSTDIEPTWVEVRGGSFDLGSSRGSLADLGERAQNALLRLTGRPAPAADGSAATPAPGGPVPAPSRRNLPPLRISQVNVDVTGQDLPITSVTLQQGSVEYSDLGWTLASTLEWGGLRLPDGITVAPQTEVNGLYNGLSSWSASVRPATPLRMAPPGLAGVEATVSGVSFTWPYFFGIEELVLNVEGQDEPLLRVPSTTIELRELTTSVEALYLANLEFTHPEVVVRWDNSSGVVAAARALMQQLRPDREDGTADPEGAAIAPATDGSGDGAAANDGSGDVDGGSGELDEGSGTSGATATAAPLWSSRRWWEKIPQQIRINTGSLRLLSADGGRDVSLRDIQMTYALRVLNFQADVNLTANLTTGSTEPVAQRARLTWGWTTDNLTADVQLQQIPIGELLRIVTGGSIPFTGEADLELRVNEAPRRGRGASYVCDLDAAMGLGLRNLMVLVPGVPGPLTLGNVRLDFAGACTDEHPEYFEFERGEIEWEGARLSVRPRLFGFNYQAALPWNHTLVRIDVPEQPAQTLFDAVPRPLRRFLDGTQLGGTFGFGLDFEFDLLRDDDGWLRPANISPSTRWQVSDMNLQLLTLPDTIDVRRLNGPMQFIFHGPENRFERPLSVPAPRHREDTEAPAETDALPSSWVRLTDMSYYLIAMQLYREDGRFFSNDGVNWFQLRRVVEEAFTERRLGRGASTITMQLVKNVFLTHERAVERKFAELFLTYWLTRLVPKERILETYLNVIEWGPNINGIVEASRYYFGKRPSELTFAEATWLAAITPAPARRAPQREMGSPPDWMMRQVHDLMTGLHSRGMVSSSELRAGLAEEIRFVTHPGHGMAQTAGGVGVAEQNAPPFEPGVAPDAAAAVATAQQPDAIGSTVAPLSPDEQEENVFESAFLALPHADRIRSMISSGRNVGSSVNETHTAATVDR